MGKFTSSKRFSVGLLMLLVLFLIGCAPSQNSYERKYNKVWDEIVESEAWKNSLMASTGIQSEQEFGAPTAITDVRTLDDRSVMHLSTGRVFSKKYNSLVSRAYYKIIAEAENADIRLKLEYERWNLKKYAPDQAKDPIFVKDLEQVNNKYQAHREMLMGLRSWNIFSENRTGDLEYFKRENYQEVLRMYQKGFNDDDMVNFLVYRLADLYHAGSSQQF